MLSILSLSSCRQPGAVWSRLLALLLLCCLSTVAQCQDLWVQVGDAFGDEGCQAEEVAGNSRFGYDAGLLFDEAASVGVHLRFS